MATTTDSILSERETQHGRAGAPPPTPRPSRRRRRIAWASAAVACVAAATIGVAMIGDGTSDTSAPPNRDALVHQADEYVAWLTARAGSVSDTATTGSGNLDALAHQGDQYLEWLDSQAEAASGDASVDDVVPGSRHMPSR
jgi:hypothetical protein